MNNEVVLPSNSQMHALNDDKKPIEEIKQKLDYSGQLTKNNEPSHPSRPYQVFTENSLLSVPTNSLNLANLAGKALLISVLAIPIIILGLSLYTYLYNNDFDIMVLGGYPRWLSSQVELFVKANIVPMMQK